MKLGIVAGSLIAVGSMAGVARADEVLVFGDHAGRHRIADELAALGHTVTDTEVMPARLDGFAQVWHLGAVAPLTETEQKLMAAFVNRGGGLFLTGDGPGCEALDASIETILDSTIAGGGVTVSATAIPAAHHRFQPAALMNAAATPNELWFWEPTVSGSLDNVAPIDVLTTSADGAVTSALWGGPDMSNGRGQLVVMMDAGWVTRPYPIDRIVENVELFLRKGVPATCGNAVTELGETCDDANATTGDGCDLGCQTEPTDDGTPPAAGADPHDGTGGVSPDDPSDPSDDEVDDLAYVGCSAGGGGGAGGLVLMLAMLGLVTRRR